MAYSADSMSLFGDIYLRDDEQLNWKPGMLEFNFHLTEVHCCDPRTLALPCRDALCRCLCCDCVSAHFISWEVPCSPWTAMASRELAVMRHVPMHNHCLPHLLPDILLQELYRAAYGEPLSADGSMFRGTPPPLWRTDPNPGDDAHSFDSALARCFI